MPVAAAIADERWQSEPAIERLFAARRRFQAKRTDEMQTDAAKRFSSQYLLRLAAVLPLAEITVLLSAEQYREQGLALGRKDEHDAAWAQLSQAAAICEKGGLSHHASIAALSFQLAAEAYIRHRCGDHSGAIRDLENAIVAAAELETIYGYDMVFRRIHLARNILRVRAADPLDREVIDDSIALLNYIGGDTTCWPIGTRHGIGNAAAMATSQKAWAIDELLVNLALPTVDLARGAGGFFLAEAADDDLRAAFYWYRGITNLHRGNRRQFIDDATLFFEAGSGRLIHAGEHFDTLLTGLG